MAKTKNSPANVQTEQAPVNETLVNETPAQDATPAQDETPAPKTDEEILAELTSNYEAVRKELRDAEDNGAEETVIDALVIKSAKTRELRKKHIVSMDAKVQQKLAAEQLNEHVGVIDTFAKVITDLLNATPDQIAAIAENSGYNVFRNKIVEELKKSFGISHPKVVIFAGQGVTGKQIAKAMPNSNGDGKKTASDELIELMQAGKTNDELEAMFPDRYPRTDKNLVHGTIRSARNRYNQMLKGSA